MASWVEFSRAAREIAELGELRLFQLGPGLAFLPPQDADDEFYLTGRAHERTDPALIERIEAAQRARGATTGGTESAFELDVEHALRARYKPRGEPDSFPPEYLKWSEGR